MLKLAESITELDLLENIKQMLRDRLPKTWNIEAQDHPTLFIPALFDCLSVGSPGGGVQKLAVMIKTTLEARDISKIRDQYNFDNRDGVWDAGVVAARYISPNMRERIKAAGLSYVDATGNIFISSDTLPFYVADHGLDSDPWRGPGRPRGTLKGKPAAQVVRALIDEPGPWRISELVKASATSTGSVYRVLDFLESEELIVRGADGKVSLPDWVPLLRRWSLDYEFFSNNVVSKWIAPRGIDSVIEAAESSDPESYTITGSVAAATWAPYAPLRSVMAYVTNTKQIAGQWGLRATEEGANVFLAEPAFPALIRGAIRRHDCLMIAAPAQVAADLLTGPGRAPNEAEELIRWMVSNEHKWR